MGARTNANKIWNFIFWCKAFIAIGLSVYIFALMGQQIVQLRIEGVAFKQQEATPIEIDASRCAYTPRAGLGRLEPPPGEKMVGFHLDWTKQIPTQVRSILKRPPAVINAFLQLSATANPPIRWGDFIWHAQETARIGGIFQLTIEPDTMDIPDSILEQVAKECLQVNKMGVPMLLRYGHEMNGDWASYGVQPVTFRAGFIRMANMIRRYTNMTAMVWAPNVGINYPFFGSKPLPTRVTDPINFPALDTNADGVIDYRDDPYLPYYPGDDYVDWVGISLYWYPDENALFNQEVPATFFQDQMTGTGVTTQQYAPNALLDGGLRDFYTRFAQARNKPLMVAETASPYFPNRPKAVQEATVKQEWWQQLYGPDSFNRFPLLKLIIHFEESKKDSLGEVRDWRILADPATRDAFVGDLKAISSKVVYADNLSYKCDGTLSLKAAPK